MMFSAINIIYHNTYPMRVSVVGLGRAGLPLAAVIADSGLPVLGVDVNPKVVDKINSGVNPIPEEPGLVELIEKHSGGNIVATTDYADIKDSDSHIVIVPLFLDKDNKPDFSIIDSAFANVGKNMKKGDLVVLETTVPPTTTETRIKDILERESGMKAGVDFHLAYSPERIMTGYSISRYREFPKVVGGLTPKCTERVFELYSKFAKPVKVADAKTAELVKVSEGVYRDVNISLANELFRVCEEIGVDFWQMRGAANHAFCHIHEPGLVGGHCIPVYPHFLINDYKVPLIEGARNLNEEMVVYYLAKVKEITAQGKVCVVGLSYRTGVRETVHTMSHKMIKALKNEGYEVYGIDSLFNPKEVEKYFKVKPLSDWDAMDAVIVLNTNKKYLKMLEVVREKVVDVKNILG